MSSERQFENSVENSAVLVVGHGRDPGSDRVLTVAADLALTLGARLHVVHAVVLGDYPIDIDSADWEERGEQALVEEREHVAAILNSTGVHWTYECSRGVPAKALTAAAEQHDAMLIVVGSRGEGVRAVLSRLTQPSVSHALIEHQPRPVLVVPRCGHGAERVLDRA